MTKRKEKDDAILKCATTEFLENGYMAASLRVIAKRAGTTTGSIYSRYRSKNELFNALVEKPASDLIQIIKVCLKEIRLGTERHAIFENYLKSVCRQLFEYMCNHRNEVKILTACADGTIYECFIADLVEIELNYQSTLWPKKLKLLHANTLIRVITKAFYTAFFEYVLASGQEMNDKDLYYFDMLTQFYIAGWNNILLQLNVDLEVMLH